jgi:hypothetical protein
MTMSSTPTTTAISAATSASTSAATSVLASAAWLGDEASSGPSLQAEELITWFWNDPEWTLGRGEGYVSLDSAALRLSLSNDQEATLRQAFHASWFAATNEAMDLASQSVWALIDPVIETSPGIVLADFAGSPDDVHDRTQPTACGFEEEVGGATRTNELSVMIDGGATLSSDVLVGLPMHHSVIPLV